MRRATVRMRRVAILRVEGAPLSTRVETPGRFDGRRGPFEPDASRTSASPTTGWICADPSSVEANRVEPADPSTPGEPLPPGSHRTTDGHRSEALESELLASQLAPSHRAGHLAGGKQARTVVRPSCRRPPHDV